MKIAWMKSVVNKLLESSSKMNGPEFETEYKHEETNVGESVLSDGREMKKGDENSLEIECFHEEVCNPFMFYSIGEEISDICEWMNEK